MDLVGELMKPMKMRVLSSDMVNYSINIFDVIELAAAQGQTRQLGAIRKVLLMNWRGIINTTALIVLANYVFLTLSPYLISSQALHGC